MASPKAALSGELAKLAKELREALSKRSTDLSADGAKSIERMSPEQRVALDAALEGGARLEEVQGVGDNLIPEQPARPIQLDFNATPEAQEIRRWYRDAEAPTMPEVSARSADWNYLRNTWQEANPKAIGPANNPNWKGPADTRLDSRERPFHAFNPQDTIAQENSVYRYVGGGDAAEVRAAEVLEASGDQRGDWPPAWRDWENIPAVAATVGAGALLASGNAEAADDWTKELQPDPRDPNSGQPNPDALPLDQQLRIKRMGERVRRLTEPQPAPGDKFFQPQLVMGASPKAALSGELAKRAKQLADALAGRSVSLSADGAKSIEGFKDFGGAEASVRLDEALEKGGVSEVKGSDTNLVWRHGDFAVKPDQLAGPDMLTGGNPYDVHRTPSVPSAEEADSIHRATRAYWDNAEVNEAQRGPWYRGRDYNVFKNEPVLAEGEVGSWPDSWLKTENIPAVAATVGAGAALTAGTAEAADDVVDIDDGAEPIVEIDDGAEPIVDVDDGAAPVQVAAPDFGPLAQTTQMPAGIGAPLPPPQRKHSKAGAQQDLSLEAIKTIFAPAQYIKDEYLAPIVKQVQAYNRAMYFGAGGGFQLRKDAPNLAFAVENLGKVALGETDLNRPGDPAQLPAINAMEQTFGTKTAAFVQSFEQGLGNLPFYLIPGVGQGAALQGATGGFLSAMVDPATESVAEETMMGAVGGKVLDAGAKAAGKLLKPVGELLQKNINPDVKKWGAKPEVEILPVAIMPADAEPQLADAIFKLSDEALVDPKLGGAIDPAVPPSPSMYPEPGALKKALNTPEPARVAKVKPQKHGIMKNKWGAPEFLPEDPDIYRNPAGPHAGLKKPGISEADVMSNVVPEPAPKAEAPAPAEAGTNAGSPAARARAAARKQEPVAVAVDIEDGVMKKAGLGISESGQPIKVKAPENFDGKVVLTERAKAHIRDNPGDNAYADLFKMKDFSLSREELILMEVSTDAPLKQGSVVVLEGHGGTGTARLYDVDDLKLQRKILEKRGLAEYITPDKQRVLGYHEPGSQGDIFLPPEAAEKIPGAAPEGITLAPGEGAKVRLLTGYEIDNLLKVRAQVVADEAEQLALKAAQQQAAEADMALGGNGNGDKLPPNPAHPPEAMPVPPNPHNVDPVEELRVKWWQQQAATLQRKLLAPTVYGPRDVSDQAMRAFSTQTFERLRDDVYTSLNKSTPGIRKLAKAEQKIVHQNIVRYMTGELPEEQLLKSKHFPAIADQVFTVVNKYKEQIKVNEARIRELGMLPSEKDARKALKLADEEDLPGWAVQMYYRHLLSPGEWNRRIRKDKAKVDRVMAGIMEDVINNPKNKKKFGTMSDENKLAEAQKYFEVITGNEQALQDLLGLGKKPSDFLADARFSLKGRNKDMKPWVREALGFIEDPFARVAESVTRQEQLIQQGTLWKSVAENPAFSTSADNEAVAQALGHTKTIPTDPSTYGLAAGRKVSPSTYYALHEAPRLQRNAANVVSRFVNAIKYNQTVLNPGSWITNFFANAQGAVLSNLVNPFTSPGEIGHGMVRLALDMKAFKAAPGIRGTPDSDRFMKAIELGIVGSEYSTAEFRRSAGEFERAMNEATKGQQAKILDVLQWFPYMAGKSKDKLAGLYSAIDTSWKYATYVSGLRRGGIRMDGSIDLAKATKFIGGRMRPTMGEKEIREQVELEVARRIHLAFPMLDRVGEGIVRMGRAAGVVNPYIKIKTELMRNYAQLPGRVKAEDGMAANLMGYGLMVGATAGAVVLAREANGINQKEVDSAFANAPPAFKRFKPGAMVLPMRQADGQLLTIDLTQLFEPLTWLQGDPTANMATDALVNLTLLGVDGSPVEPGTRELLVAAGIVPPEFHQKDIPEWQRGGSKLLSETIGRMGPGAIRNTYNTIAKNPQLGAFTPAGGRMEPLPGASPGVTAANLVLGPNRITPLGSPQQADRNMMSVRMELEQAKRDYRALARMNEGQSTGILTAPLNKAEAEPKALAVLEAKIAALEAQLNGGSK